jgi:hypothetical protein
VTSGETGGNVEATLDGLAEAAQNLFPEEDTRAEWHMSDDAQAMSQGIYNHLLHIGSKVLSLAPLCTSRCRVLGTPDTSYRRWKMCVARAMSS